jgi:hypothetical protein
MSKKDQVRRNQMKVLRVVLALMLALSVLSAVSFAKKVDKALMIGGYHDLRATGQGGKDLASTGQSYALCNYCHVAHKFAADSQYGGLGPNGPGALLWNHTLSGNGAYTTYGSPTMQNKDIASLQPSGNAGLDVQNPSILCMSCHDGTVAVNSSYTGSIGTVNALGQSFVINPADANKTHPVNFTYDATLAANAGLRVPAGTQGG